MSSSARMGTRDGRSNGKVNKERSENESLNKGGKGGIQHNDSKQTSRRKK